MMSIQAIKGVEIGLGFEAAKRFGLRSMMRSVTKRVKDTLGIPTTWEVWREV